MIAFGVGFGHALLTTHSDEIWQANLRVSGILYRTLQCISDQYGATLVGMTPLFEMPMSNHTKDLVRYVDCVWELPFCQAQKYLLLIVSPILALTSTVGNSLGLVVMTRASLRNTATAVFISSLAVSDTIAVWTGLSRHFIRQLTGYDIRQYSEWACRFQRFFLYLSLDTSAWILCAISTERFLAVCMPHRHKLLKPTGRAWKAVLAIIFIQTVFNSNVFFTYGAQTVMSGNETVTFSCGFSSNTAREYLTVYHGWLALSVYCLIPVIVMLVFNTLIIVKLSKIRRSFSQRRSFSTRNKRSQGSVTMTTMLLSVTFCFVIITSPGFIFAIYEQHIFENSVVTPEFNARIKFADAIFTLLLYSNHSINFFLYCLSGRRFKMELIQLMRCKQTLTSHKSRKLTENASEMPFMVNTSAIGGKTEMTIDKL